MISAALVGICGPTPNIDLHDLIERDAVLAAVAELGRAVEACAAI
jgi:hypothetical protein